jgi:glycine/D-amino acid oxidase-like deaminating enzyme
MIIGGGPVGLSTALHLLQNDTITPSSIVIAERDPCYTYNSASLSAGGCRTQFSLDENIKLSKYMLELLADDCKLLTNLVTKVCEAQNVSDYDIPTQLDIKQSINFMPGGYLFLAATKEGADSLLRNSMIQPHTDILKDAACIADKFSYLNTEDLTAGAHTSKDGWLDPYGLLTLLTRVLKACNVQFVNSNVALHSFSDDAVTELKAADGTIFTPGTIINCAGANANSLLPPQHALPIAARSRTIFHMTNKSLSEGGKVAVGDYVPLTVDPCTGVWWRGVAPFSEGTNDFLAGSSPVEGDEDPDDLRVSDLSQCKGCIEPSYSQFDDTVWPALYNRVECFGDVKVQNQWAGWYDYNTTDQNGIVGRHPVMKNVILGNGWSGHGMQMGLGVGRHLAEVIVASEKPSIDLARFRIERFDEGKEIFEEGIV